MVYTLLDQNKLSAELEKYIDKHLNEWRNVWKELMKIQYRFVPIILYDYDITEEDLKFLDNMTNSNELKKLEFYWMLGGAAWKASFNELLETLNKPILRRIFKKSISTWDPLELKEETVSLLKSGKAKHLRYTGLSYWFSCLNDKSFIPRPADLLNKIAKYVKDKEFKAFIELKRFRYGHGEYIEKNIEYYFTLCRELRDLALDLGVSNLYEIFYYIMVYL